MTHTDPSLAIIVLSSWVHDGGRNSERFQEFAGIAANNAENDFELFYDSYVSLAILSLGCTSRHTGFDPAQKFATIRRTVLSGQVDLSVGRVEVGGEFAARLTPFLDRVETTLNQDTVLSPIPAVPAFAFQAVRTLDVISSFVVSLIEMHVNVSDIPSVSDALERYAASIDEVLG